MIVNNYYSLVKLLCAIENFPLILHLLLHILQGKLSSSNSLLSQDLSS